MVTGPPPPGGHHLGVRDRPRSVQPAPTGTPWEEELRRLAGSVPDPELPVLTLEELGVLRDVQVLGPGRVEVELSPTYTGCPAIETMAADIEQVLHEHGVADVTVRRVLSPPWTTDDISDEGRRKLRESGIAPPRTQRTTGPVPLTLGPTRTGAPAPPDRAGEPGQAGQPGQTDRSDQTDAAERRQAIPTGQPGPTAPGERAGRSGPALTPGPTEGPVPCPHCGSADSELLSRFSSTACKALRRCLACREPFDHFKEV